MYETSARLTAGMPAERRALLSALQCVAGTGTPAAGETLYQRLQKAGATNSELAQDRPALRANGPANPHSGSPASALPKVLCTK